MNMYAVPATVDTTGHQFAFFKTEAGVSVIVRPDVCNQAGYDSPLDLQPGTIHYVDIVPTTGLRLRVSAIHKGVTESVVDRRGDLSIVKRKAGPHVQFLVRQGKETLSKHYSLQRAREAIGSKVLTKGGIPSTGRTNDPEQAKARAQATKGASNGGGSQSGDKKGKKKN